MYLQKSYWIKPKSNCIYHFPIERPFSSKSIRKYENITLITEKIYPGASYISCTHICIYYWVAFHYVVNKKLSIRDVLNKGDRTGNKLTTAVHDTSISRHNGGPIKVPLKPLNTIDCAMVSEEPPHDSKKR